jgi:inorganic pyrophosphatase
LQKNPPGQPKRRGLNKLKVELYYIDMNLWQDIQPGAPDELNVIIETPHGSHNKYELDKKTGLIKLDRANYSGIPFPFNYGFVPQTLWDDGDPLDVVLLTTFPIQPGILVPARPVALMEMNDTGEDDAKVVCVPAEDKWWDDVRDASDLNTHLIKVIKNFFESYKALKGKPAEVKTGEFKDKKIARAAVEKGIRLYQEKFGK